MCLLFTSFFVKRIQDVLGEVGSATRRYGNYVTAGSCFFGRMQENQGLWELKTEFLYQIYTKILGFGAVKWLSIWRSESD